VERQRHAASRYKQPALALGQQKLKYSKLFGDVEADAASRDTRRLYGTEEP
jgi:hypothetical protein